MLKLKKFLIDTIPFIIICILGYFLYRAIYKQVDGSGIFAIVLGIIFFSMSYSKLYSLNTNSGGPGGGNQIVQHPMEGIKDSKILDNALFIRFFLSIIPTF
jgi:hypothetical protein